METGVRRAELNRTRVTLASIQSPGGLPHLTRELTHLAISHLLGLLKSAQRRNLLDPFPVVNKGTPSASCKVVAFKDDGWFAMKRKLELNTPVFDRYRRSGRRAR
jgi:hypothetical protein